MRMGSFLSCMPCKLSRLTTATRASQKSQSTHLSCWNLYYDIMQCHHVQTWGSLDISVMVYKIPVLHWEKNSNNRIYTSKLILDCNVCVPAQWVSWHPCQCHSQRWPPSLEQPWFFLEDQGIVQCTCTQNKALWESVVHDKLRWICVFASLANPTCCAFLVRCHAGIPREINRAFLAYCSSMISMFKEQRASVILFEPNSVHECPAC